MANEIEDERQRRLNEEDRQRFLGVAQAATDRTWAREQGSSSERGPRPVSRDFVEQEHFLLDQTVALALRAQLKTPCVSTLEHDGRLFVCHREGVMWSGCCIYHHG